MNLFTPAFLAFVPIWATTIALQSTVLAMSRASLPRATPPKPDRDENCPTLWATMPFTPPAVHAA